MDALWTEAIGDWREATAASPPDAPARRPRRRRAHAPDGPVTGASPPAGSVDLDRADTADVGAAPGGGVASLPVEVIRSAKRRKSVSARVVDGRIVVRMPQWMSKAQEAEYVEAMRAKLARQHEASTIDLPVRARELARRYDLPEPASIRWVSNQSSRWGSCTPSSKEIRISDRIAAFPTWVVDAVIVHELAHLVHLHHTAEFWALANRYPKTERAYGYLIAKQITGDDPAPA